MEISDLPVVMALEQATFADPWTHDHFVYEINDNPYALAMIAEQDGQLLGFYDIWIMFEQATLNQIAVDRRYWRRGIASTMLVDALGRLKAAGAEQLTLEVRVSNDAAQAFYAKHGFELVMRKPQYYANGEDALYMVRKI